MLGVLRILCGLMAVFAGGCAIWCLSAGVVAFALIAGLILGMNVSVLLAVSRRRPPEYAGFAILAALDLVIAALIFTVVTAMFVKAPADRDLLNDGLFSGGIGLASALLVKGVLTITAALILRRERSTNAEVPGKHPGPKK